MNLTTRYLGFDLPHPLVPGAGPLCDTLDGARRLEDAGAPLLVMRSLFEEQVVDEQVALAFALDAPAESFAEAMRYLPEPQHFVFGPEEYLEHLGRLKDAVSLPIVASLNGTTPGGWLEYARRIEQAGASALELNLYELPTDARRTSAAIEDDAVALVEHVRGLTRFPLAVKLSSFYSSLPDVARRLGEAGADALVLFNRFLQPDVDPVALQIRPELRLSSPSELNLRLRWLAILHGRFRGDLCATGGVHSAVDAVKALQCGASAVQVVSVLLQRGPGHLRELQRDLADWLEQNEHPALRPMIGSMSHQRCPDPGALERANYARMLQTWRR
jgi:dihydroorotate dehydrogenase (fumarate)